MSEMQGLKGGHLFGSELKNRFSVSDDHVVFETNKVPVIVDRRVHERFLTEFGPVTITIQTNGYAYFGSTKTLLHIWIAETFLGPRTDATVDHVDRVCTDNRLSNLRWASQSTQNANRGCVRTTSTATPLPEIAPGFTSVDLPKFVHYRPSAVEKTGATRGDFFAVERGDVRRKTESRKSLTLLEKYYQAIAIADREGILRGADDLDPVGAELREEAIALFRHHALCGGATHPVASDPIGDPRPEPRAPEPRQTLRPIGNKRKQLFEDAPPKTVKLSDSGPSFRVFAKAGVHVVCDDMHWDAASFGEWSVDSADGASVSIKQAIRTNKKTTLKGDLGQRFPAMRDWPSDKISLPEFVWCFCMGRELLSGHAVSSRNKIPGDVRECNLCLAKKTGDRVPRVVVCPPPPGLDVPHGLLPLDLSVAYRPAKVDQETAAGEGLRELSNFSITGNLLKAAGVTWRGSTKATETPAIKYGQAMDKLRGVYGVLGRDLDQEHAEYAALVGENRDIVEAFRTG